MVMTIWASFTGTFGRESQYERSPFPLTWKYCTTNFAEPSVLLPNSDPDPKRLFVIDWEYAQFGHRAIDIRGMMADLYERKHFYDVDTVIPVMRGFAEGYGRMSDDIHSDLLFKRVFT